MDLLASYSHLDARFVPSGYGHTRKKDEPHDGQRDEVWGVEEGQPVNGGGFDEGNVDPKIDELLDEAAGLTPPGTPTPRMTSADGQRDDGNASGQVQEGPTRSEAETTHVKKSETDESTVDAFDGTQAYH